MKELKYHEKAHLSLSAVCASKIVVGDAFKFPFSSCEK